MASELLRLEDVAVITDSLHSTPTYSSEGYPMVRVTDVRDFYLDTAGSLRVSKGIYQEFTKREVPKRGDIVFTRVGSYGNSCLAADDKEFCLGQNTALIRPLIDPYYLLFCLKSSFVRKQIESAVVGSTQKTISIKSIKQLLIPIASQQHVEFTSAAMKSIQDKIELNRKTNETLERIVKALFKSWFVDFDPARAKAGGRSTGLPDEISELFPDSLEESELGEIPSGWECRPLSDFFSIQGGSQPPAKTFIDDPREGYVRLLQIRDFLGDSHLTFVPEAKNLRLVSEDDVLIGRYGSGSGKFMDDSLGRPLRGLSGAINVAVVRTIPQRPNMVELIYAMVLSGWFYRQIVGGSARAVQAGFRKEDLDLIPFAMPPDQLLDVFQKFGSNIWKRTKLLKGEINTLCSLRDALLPRLISGELRVPDAEKMLEEVGI